MLVSASSSGKMPQPSPGASTSLWTRTWTYPNLDNRAREDLRKNPDALRRWVWPQPTPVLSHLLHMSKRGLQSGEALYQGQNHAPSVPSSPRTRGISRITDSTSRKGLVIPSLYWFSWIVCFVRLNKLFSLIFIWDALDIEESGENH